MQQSYLLHFYDLSPLTGVQTFLPLVHHQPKLGEEFPGTHICIIAKMKPKLPDYEFSRFQQSISPERLEAYRSCASDTNLDVLSTYLWNIALAESLYPVLHNFEIAIRNSFHQAISRLFYEDWLPNADLKILHTREVESVKSAIKNLQEKQQNISTGNVISELTLGFWVSLSYVQYEGKDKPLYPRLFKDKEFMPHLPKSLRTRHILSSRFAPINKLRNRIFHHKPIWKESKELEKNHDNALEVIQWISPILYETTKNLSRFPDVYAQRNVPDRNIIKKIITPAPHEAGELTAVSYPKGRQVFEER